MSKGYAIVTGAARGLGKAMFLQLAKEGYDLIGVYVSDSSGKKMQDIIDQVTKENGVRAFGCQSDVGTFEGCKKIVDFSVEKFGKDAAVLINNAGVAGGAAFAEETPENIKHTIDVDLMSALYLSSLVLPFMIERKGGDIISFSSIGALAGVPFQSVYSSAKAGLTGFSKVLAKEVAPYNIKVNVIAPGVFDTDMVAAADPEQKKATENAIPMGRLGDPKEIALLMSYMIESDYLTGQTISPNGGFVSIP